MNRSLGLRQILLDNELVGSEMIGDEIYRWDILIINIVKLKEGCSRV